jgi:hypothetical protein
LLGDGDGHFRPGPPVGLALASGVTAVPDAALGDLDGDRRLDLLAVVWPEGPRLLKGLPGGGFIDVTRASGLDRRLISASAAVADLDGDGRLDIVVSQWSPYPPVLARLLGRRLGGGLSPVVFRNAGGGRFEVVADTRLAIPMGSSLVRAGDLDGDGRPELVFANGALAIDRIEPPVVLANRGAMRFFDDSARYGMDAIVKAWAVATDDLDGDGRPDLLVCGGGLAPGDRWPGHYWSSRSRAVTRPGEALKRREDARSRP